MSSPTFIIASPAVAFSASIGSAASFEISPGVSDIIFQTAGQNLEFNTGVGNLVCVAPHTYIDGYVTIGSAESQDNLNIIAPTQSTVGTGGSASNIPTAPALYFKIMINDVEYVIPLFPVS